MTRRPAFWIVAAALCGLCGAFAFVYFPVAFPIASVDIRMDRRGALAAADRLAEQRGWGPASYRQAASFGLEPGVQEFIELEGGGQDAFREVLANDTFHPYRWTVRHFRERERNETRIWFAPDGSPYGFRQQLAEDAPGAALDAAAALTIAENVAATEWGIDFAAFERVETSQETRPGGRVDHTFEYERVGARYGAGNLRLRLAVSGDELAELRHFLEVPEAFTRRYAEMRSTNDLIGALGQIGALLGYLLVGCAVALFFLFRERWVVWKQPVLWGVLVSFLQVLVTFNQLPLLWMGYDTALSSQNFLLQQIGVALVFFVVLTGVFAVSFMAAESLTRKAFPDHIQLWRSFSPGVANTPAMAGRVVIAYLVVGVFFAYEVSLYFIAHNVLGWWSPSGALGQPDVLATYVPWLTAIAASLQAGFWEESLFRAVPLAGAALLGRRFGRPTAWIVAAFIVQALIFGAGHAPYPTQPSYARVVELIIPSIGFGLFYMRFGLLPAVVLHYAYDVVWFAIPLFVQSAPGAWVDRTILILLLFLPLLVVVGSRARAGAWVEASPEDRNAAWEPPPARPVEPVDKATMATGSMHPLVRRGLPAAALVGSVLWFVSTGADVQSPPIEIGRRQAVAAARAELAGRGVQLDAGWRALASTATLPSPQHRFVWQEGGAESFEALSGTYLGEPRWVVRFARFEGDVAERAEEYFVHVSAQGEIVRFAHRLPEARPGADLSEAEARQIAGRAVRAFGLPFGDPDEPGGLYEISAETAKRPERRDWTFTFEDADNYPLTEGSGRVEVTIAGDRVADARRFVHVPEEWARADRNRQVVPDVLGIVGGVVVALIMLAGAVVGGVSWAKKDFSVPTFLVVFAAGFGLAAFNFANAWPVTLAGFSTAMPISTQIVIFMAGVSIGAVALAAALALLAGWLHRPSRPATVAVSLGESLWTGVSLGLLVAGLATAAAALAPSSTPPWAAYGNADAYFPAAGTALSPVIGLITTTLFVFFAFSVAERWTAGWTRRVGLASSAVVVIGMVTAAGTSSGLIAWVLSGALVGAALLAAFRMVVRYDLAALPVAVGASLGLEQLAGIVSPAYPGAEAGRIAALIVIAAVSVGWAAKLTGRPRSG